MAGLCMPEADCDVFEVQDDDLNIIIDYNRYLAVYETSIMIN
jgi:hypothetical protein